MHLLGKQLGNISDLAVGLAHPFVRTTEIVENAGLREADINALHIAHVANVAGSTDADDRKNTEIVAVVENLRQIVGHLQIGVVDRKSTRLNSSHANISYAVVCLNKKTKNR